MVVINLVGAMAALMLVLVVIPRRVFPRLQGASALEQLAANFVWACAAITVTSVVLVPLNLFQSLCFLILATGGMWYRWSRRGGTMRGEIEQWATRGRAALYVLEAASHNGNADVKRAVKTWLGQNVLGRLWPKVPTATRALRWVMVGPLFLIVGATTAAHLFHPLRHDGLFPSSAYRTAARMGEFGIGRLFGDGIEAPGLAAVLAAAAKLGPASDADLVRFAGALLLIPTLLAVYAIALRVTAHPGFALATTAIAAVSSLRPEVVPGIELPGTVPSGLALAIGLAAVLLAMGYASAPTRARALTIAGAAAAVALTDPALVALPLLAAAGAFLAAASRTRRVWLSIRPLAFAAVTVAAGLAPYELVRGGGGFDLPTIVDPNFADPLTVIAFASGLLVIVRYLGRQTPGAGSFVALAPAVLASCAVEEALALRALGPVMVLAAFRGQLPRPVTGLRLTRSVAVGVAMCAGLFVFVQPSTPTPAAASEYESAAAVLDQLMAGETDFTYTVIGPPTWTSRVVGAAYRADLAQFARRLTVTDAMDPGFTLPVPTKRVLVLIERRAFETDFGGWPYDDAVARAELMRTADQWLEEYARFHQGADVVYKDSEIRVWRLEQARDAALSERFGMARQ